MMTTLSASGPASWLVMVVACVLVAAAVGVSMIASRRTHQD